MSYNYPLDYFTLQFQFASQWSRITGKSLARSLVDETSLYRRVIGKVHNQTNIDPAWDKIMEEMGEAQSPKEMADFLYQYYLHQNHENEEGTENQFGSFSFNYEESTKTIRVHFKNKSKAEKSDLAKEYVSERLAELKQMFEAISHRHPEAEWVLGHSWLYNLEAYKRLFPPAFVEKLESVPMGDSYFRTDAVWGQFIKKDGLVDSKKLTEFVSKIEEAKNVNELLQAFPFLPLQATSPVVQFYEYYKTGLEKNKFN